MRWATIGLFDVFQDDNQEPKLEPLSSDEPGSLDEDSESQSGADSSFEDLDSFDDQSTQQSASQDVPTKQRQGNDITPQEPVAPENTSGAKANHANTKSKQPPAQAKQDQEQPSQPSDLATSTDDDQGLNLNLDLEEFIPEDKDVDFDQYAEQIKETAQKGAKQNLKQQVENASEPSEIDLEGLKEDLTKEIRETAGDIAPPDKEGIGQDRDEDKEDEETDQEEKTDGTKEEEEEEEEEDEEQAEQDDESEEEAEESEESEGEEQDEDILDSDVTRPSPPTSAESARRYDATTDSLYVQKNACKRVVMDVKEVQNSLDLFRDRLNRIDTENNPAEEGKNLMSDVQRKLLDLENELFEEDTLWRIHYTSN